MSFNETHLSLPASLAVIGIAAVAAAAIPLYLQHSHPTSKADKGALSPYQRAKLVASWQLVEAMGLEKVGCLLFKNIFAMAPEALQLFSFREEQDLYNSKAYKKHCRFVMEAIRAAVEELDDANALVRQLKRLGKSHAGLGVVSVHYDVVGKALMETLGAFHSLIVVQFGRIITYRDGPWREVHP